MMHVSTSMHARNGVKMSWVTLERITREEAAKDDSLLRKLHVDRRPLRPAAAELTDHELLDKLRSMGCELEWEVRNPASVQVDWIWICLLGLWERWWPDRVCLERPAGGRKTGRNAPCPCGSGRKYKKCCGSPTAEA